MPEANYITIRRPDDFHVHFRQGRLLVDAAPHTVGVFGRLLAMPNTQPPIVDAIDMRRYRAEIEMIIPEPLHRYAKVLPTIYLTQTTTPAMIEAARDAGAIAAKLYPAGVTTNSREGPKSLQELDPVFEAMVNCGLVLSVHAESPRLSADEFEREALYIETLEDLLSMHPGLKMVIEHVSSAAMVEWIKQAPANVAATVTAHHLNYTYDSLLHDGLRPHLYCKPVFKSRNDRNILRKTIALGNPKFFFGSDSAPHPIVKKECSNNAAGIYSAPVRLPLLLGIFEKYIGLERLEDFVSRFGAEFYGLPLNPDTVSFERKSWLVPERWPGELVSLCAGERLDWCLAKGD